MALVYKIRRKSDGLFSMGGSNPHFSKTGKIWKQRNHLTNHINQLWSSKERSMYVRECEVVAYELVETQVGEGQSLADYLEEIEMRKQERENVRRARYEAYQKQQRLDMYRKLQKEFGNVD